MSPIKINARVNITLTASTNLLLL